MRILFLTLLLATVSPSIKAQLHQDDSIVSASIDSIINNIRADKTKLIYIKKGGLIIDSTLFTKAVYSDGKSKIKITFADNTSIKIHADDFWGLITDFGQCQRFHKGKIYVVWHTKTPYVYREYAASDRKITYFYSKTLVSEINPLTKENVYDIVDARTIEQLQTYLKTHDIEKSKDESGISIGGGKLPFSEIFSDGDDETPELLDLLAFHIRLHLVVLEILAEWYGYK